MYNSQILEINWRCIRKGGDICRKNASEIRAFYNKKHNSMGFNINVQNISVF